MKKVVTFGVMLTLVTRLFAFDISIGTQFDYAGTWTLRKATVPILNAKIKTVVGNNAVGFDVFGDFQYVRLGLGYNAFVGKTSMKIGDGKREFKAPNKAFLTLKLLGKYPFPVGAAKIYPLLGFEFDFNVLYKIDDVDLRKTELKDKRADLNNYYFVLGLGTDIFATDSLFFTINSCVGFQLDKKSGDENIMKISKLLGSDNYSSMGILFDLGLGVGYKF